MNLRALPKVQVADGRSRFFAGFERNRRITKAHRTMMVHALRDGIVTPEDLTEFFGLSPYTVEEWAGARRPVDLVPDLERKAWLAAQGLSGQPLIVAELLMQERGLIVSHGAILAVLRSQARSKLVPVLMHKVRHALPDLKIDNVHGIGFRYRGELPWL